MNDFCVYLYYVPGCDLPFYAGKGKPDRPYQHLQPNARKGRKCHFYYKLNKLIDVEGISPKVDIIARNLTEQQAFDLEISLIKIYGRLDRGTGCLTNHTDGGEGASGSLGCFGHKASIDARIKMSKPRSVEGCHNIRLATQKSQGVPVESFDLATGQTIKIYPSRKSVVEDGYNSGSVSRVLRCLTRHCGLVGWRYSEAKVG